MTEDQIRDLLREMRDEPIPADSRVRVLAAVMERAQGGNWSRLLHMRWSIPTTLLTIACLVLVVMWWWSSGGIYKPSTPAVASQTDPQVQKPAPLGITAPVPGNVLRRARHPARRAVQLPPHTQSEPAAGDGVLIRIETPDPDVVIVLVGG